MRKTHANRPPSIPALWAVLGAILTCLPLQAGAAGGQLPEPTSLADDARIMHTSGVPMVVLFSQASCSYCDEARTHLVPMAQDMQSGGKVKALFRQINLDSTVALVGFDGSATTQRKFSRTMDVHFTPTVLVLGPDGTVLTEPIVGMRLPDFYGLYVQNAIDQGTRRMTPQ